MKSKKQDNTEQEKQVKGQEYLICQVCGSKVKPEACSWEEDDRIHCFDCWSEIESCGCSD